MKVTLSDADLKRKKVCWTLLFLIPTRLEAAKDDYRIRCEELEKELLDAKSQNEELTSLADEAQSLKDEMDVLR